MTDEIGNLILERLKRMDARLERIRGDIADGKVRVSALEEHVSGVFIAVSGVNSRLDRLTERLLRIERRLELTDHD